jgi:hypothetical protein
LIENLNKEVNYDTKFSLAEQKDSINFDDLGNNDDIWVLEEGLVTKNVFSDKDAIQRKMEMLNTKIFGLFSPVTYSLTKKRKVFIPFELLIFHYRIEKGNNLKNSSLRVREGEIGVIYDLNEEHAFHYDLFDKLESSNKHIDNLKGVFLPAKCSDEEVVKRCKDIVQYKMLARAYKGLGILTLAKREKFYREAWELTTVCRGKEYIRYAYKDRYSPQSEHVSGLKIRLDI